MEEQEECACVDDGRCGSVTPNGIIDEDFEDALGSPAQVLFSQSIYSKFSEWSN